MIRGRYVIQSAGRNWGAKGNRAFRNGRLPAAILPERTDPDGAKVPEGEREAGAPWRALVYARETGGSRREPRSVSGSRKERAVNGLGQWLA